MGLVVFPPVIGTGEVRDRARYEASNWLLDNGAIIYSHPFGY